MDTFLVTKEIRKKLTIQIRNELPDTCFPEVKCTVTVTTVTEKLPKVSCNARTHQLYTHLCKGLLYFQLDIL